MTTWRYIKGNEKDFEGAPDWATNLYTVNKPNSLLKAWSNDSRYQYVNGFSGTETCAQVFNHAFPEDWIYPVELIAQREPVATNDNRPRSIHHPDGTVQFGCIQTPLIDVDMVNHPSHYTQGGIECIDAIKAATVGKTGIEAVCVANVVKYLWRYEEKNGLEDVKKARWYLECLINELSEGNK